MILILVFLVLPLWLLSALFTMLFIGNVHHWWPLIPTMSYGDALQIELPGLCAMIVIGGLLALLSSN